eukprot:gene12193-15520_t
MLLESPWAQTYQQEARQSRVRFKRRESSKLIAALQTLIQQGTHAGKPVRPTLEEWRGGLLLNNPPPIAKEDHFPERDEVRSLTFLGFNSFLYMRKMGELRLILNTTGFGSP